jgi:membrane protease YdiL (CAAX protease family)
VYDWLRRSLWDVVPRDQRDTAAALRRRQVVTVAVVLIGAGVLGYSLRIEPGSPTFYVSTMVLAGVWVVGAFASGRLHLGRITRGEAHLRPVVAPLTIGLALVALFVVGSLVVRQIEPLADYVSSVLAYADEGSVPVLVVITLINGIAEELFFRGAAYAGNVMLAFAAILIGLVCGLQRRASGGVLAPIITHCTWSLSMLLVLPLFFR